MAQTIANSFFSTGYLNPVNATTGVKTTAMTISLRKPQRSKLIGLAHPRPQPYVGR